MSFLVVNPGAQPAPELVTKTGEVVSLTLQPQPGEDFSKFCIRLGTRLREQSAVPLQFLVFGKCSVSAAATDEFQKVFGRVDWPITWVEGAACDDRQLAAVQIHAFTGNVERVAFEGRVVGSIFTDGGARQCLVGGVMPDKRLSRADQTRAALETLKKIFAQAGFDLADTVRTWFFLENILSWYDEFNRARTKIYSGIKFRTGSLPASTGVGAKNPAGAALALAAWAFQPIEKNAYAEEVASPLQCPAPAYGSSFSRALEISTNTGRRLFISGTASIAPGGKTLWTADVRKQIELTMDVVEAMLRSRGFAFADLARATAYFRHATDASVFTNWLAENQLADLPVVAAQCDVCRDDLLFELEADAETENFNRSGN